MLASLRAVVLRLSGTFSLNAPSEGTGDLSRAVVLARTAAFLPYLPSSTTPFSAVVLPGGGYIGVPQLWVSRSLDPNPGHTSS